MPALKNNRHEAFAQMLVEGQRRGWTQGACYSRAGYNAEGQVAEANASRLLKNAENGVFQRVQELMAGGVKRAEVTVASLLNELEMARAAAHDDKQFSSAVAAISGKFKVAGFDNRESGIGGSSEFAKCESIDDLMRTLLAGYESPAAALAELRELCTMIEDYAASHAVTIAPAAPARSRPNEAELSLTYLRKKSRRW
jgi:hypothetical protein